MLTTARTLVRPWRPEDREPFARMNADPRVMEFFPAVLTREESDAMVDRIEAHFERHGFGPWALEIPGVLPFAGFVGLMVPSFEAPFTPCVEIGWRLAQEAWGRGYAREAAANVLASRHTQDVVSFTSRLNVRSIRVMESIGMRRDLAGDFDHPRAPEGHPLRPHVLYRFP